jgi:hypothetical protein
VIAIISESRSASVRNRDRHHVGTLIGIARNTHVVQDQYGTAGTVYLDDAFLGISGGSNVLTNPGFESGNTGWSISSTGVFSIGQW